MNTTHTQPREHHGIRPWHHMVIFLLSCAVVISRRPDAILHAQFYVEDGRYWFADAYNLGWWRALFHTRLGDFQTLPRLAAALAMLVPFSLAPLALNVMAIGIVAIPVTLLLSARSSNWGSLRFRAILAVIYLALPNSAEMGMGITYSMWTLAVCAFLILVADSPTRTTWRIFDLSVLVLSALTGPFGILLMPIAIFLFWKHRDRWHATTLAVLGLACTIQAWGILLVGRGERTHGPIGATLDNLIRILGGDVYFATLFGGNIVAATDGGSSSEFRVWTVILGSLIFVLCALKARMQMRCFLVYAALVFILSLAFPHAPEIHAPDTVWRRFSAVQGTRYWFFPTLAFAWSLASLARRPEKSLKTASWPLLAIMCVGIIRDWRRPTMPDMHFAVYAKRFDSAPAGAVVIIPQNPEGWYLRLVKHSGD